MFDTDFLNLLAIASVCFGFLSGYVLRGLFRKPEKSKAYRELEKALEIEMAAVEKPQRNLSNVFSLQRERQHGRLIFEFENQIYKQGIDLPIKEREILLKVTQDLNAWLRSAVSTPQQQVSPSQPAQPQMSQVPQEQLLGQPALGLILGERRHTKPVSVHPVNVLAQALWSDVKQSAAPVQSMVAQVDAILQEKLDLAGMKKWAVRLTEFPQKGMVVLVGLEQYNGIDEVPYERVRRVIRESVSEWEQRAELGVILQ